MPAVARLFPPGYVPGRPEATALHRIVRENVSDFLDPSRAAYDSPLPRYVVDELEGYLACGRFDRGFLRCRCDACGHDMLVAFSCKRRGVCPSCAARRMCNEAAHLTDRVLPNVPIRQWVLSLPFELRRLAAFRADVLSAISSTFVREIFRAAGARGASVGSGAVTFVQRFGGSLNLNVHFHVLVLDGVFERGPNGVTFREWDPPTRAQIEDVARGTHGSTIR